MKPRTCSELESYGVKREIHIGGVDPTPDQVRETLKSKYQVVAENIVFSSTSGEGFFNEENSREIRRFTFAFSKKGLILNIKNHE